MPEALDRYAELLLEWNRRLNLTSARSRAELQTHLDDAQRFLALPWSGINNVIDVGSGGGLPAIPLALQLPGVRFTLLEADRRKAVFLQHAGGVLSLPNIEVVVGRAELVGHNPGLREHFDRAISRAVAPPLVLLELALPFVRPGGDLLAAVGTIAPAALHEPARQLGGAEVRLQPAGLPSRFFLVVSKRMPTPTLYPRRPGLARKRPLGGAINTGRPR